jgi:hypothetical protein
VEFPTVAVGSHEIWLTARRADGSVAAKFKRRVDVGAGDTVECAFTTADRVP